MFKVIMLSMVICQCCNDFCCCGWWR